jgi:Domain of unknown function (DUF397)
MGRENNLGCSLVGPQLESGMGESQVLIWRKSGKCEADHCLEVAEAGSEILIRDSQRPDAVLRVSRSDWDVFAAGMAAGDFQFA